MKKTNTLNLKIKRYAALAGGVVASSAASAQVNYTDVSPDVTISTSGTTQYVLDLDGDLTGELAFVVSSGSNPGTFSSVSYTVNFAGAGAAFGTSAASTNGWMGSGTVPSNVPTSNMIGSTGTFVQAFGTLGASQTTYLGAPYGGTYGPYTDGNFLGSEGYIGIRFDISGATHYGWARVEVASDGKSLTIKDYAYDQTAGAAIPAGDVGTGIDELNIENLVHFVNSQTNKVIVKTKNLTNGTINVVGIDGKSISSTKIANNSELVDLNGLAAGIYVINVTSNEGFLSKKVYVR